MTNSIQIDYAGIRHFLQVGEAVILANELLQNRTFYDRIADHSSFDLADITPEEIAHLMRLTPAKMSINLYYAFSSTINIDGYDDLDNPEKIHLNIWKLDRTAASICNSMIHACVHAINAYCPQYTFGHGDKSIIKKENTAPYWIGALAQSMVSNEHTAILPLQHDPNEPPRKRVKKDVDALQAYAQSIWLTT